MNPLATALTVFAGMVLAFLFEYIPGFSTGYQKLSVQWKKLLMLGLLAVAAIGSMLLACYSPYDMGIECSEASAWDLLFATIIALGIGGSANQATHALTKRNVATDD